MTELQFRHKYLHSGRAQGVRVRRTQAHIDDFALICERANNPNVFREANAKLKRKRRR